MQTTDTISVRFNPLIKPFLVLRIGLALTLSIIGLPLAVIWFLGLGRWWAQHYYDRLECQLSATTLRFRKGILVQVEKTIPLENIQDVTFLEGPILRRFQLSTLKFETAGQSVGQANDMHLTGIVDAHEFRNQIMQARERLKHNAQAAHSLSGTGHAGSDPQVVAELQGITQRLDQIIRLLENKA